MSVISLPALLNSEHTPPTMCLSQKLIRGDLGNGNPLQCSCLENPKDGGAWWAAVSGVAQSWTRLKRQQQQQQQDVTLVIPPDMVPQGMTEK